MHLHCLPDCSGTSRTQQTTLSGLARLALAAHSWSAELQEPSSALSSVNITNEAYSGQAASDKNAPDSFEAERVR